MVQKPGRHCLLYRTARHRPVAGRQRPTGEKGWGNSGPVTRASLHSSPATIYISERGGELREALRLEAWMKSHKSEVAII